MCRFECLRYRRSCCAWTHMGLRPCEHLLLSCSAARLPVTSSSLIALLLASIGRMFLRSWPYVPTLTQISHEAVKFIVIDSVKKKINWQPFHHAQERAERLLDNTSTERITSVVVNGSGHQRVVSVNFGQVINGFAPLNRIHTVNTSHKICEQFANKIRRGTSTEYTKSHRRALKLMGHTDLRCSNVWDSDAPRKFRVHFESFFTRGSGAHFFNGPHDNAVLRS